MFQPIVDKAKYIERVRKLRAVTVDRGATEAEAAAASERAAFLMAKHSITEMELVARTPIGAKLIVKRQSREMGWKDDWSYCAPTASTVAEAYGLDARAFRSWLRARSILGEDRADIFMDRERCDAVVSFFNNRRGQRGA